MGNDSYEVVDYRMVNLKFMHDNSAILGISDAEFWRIIYKMLHVDEYSNTVDLLNNIIEKVDYHILLNNIDYEETLKSHHVYAKKQMSKTNMLVVREYIEHGKSLYDILMGLDMGIEILMEYNDDKHRWMKVGLYGEIYTIDGLCAVLEGARDSLNTCYNMIHEPVNKYDRAENGIVTECGNALVNVYGNFYGCDVFREYLNYMSMCMRIAEKRNSSTNTEATYIGSLFQLNKN